VWVRETNGANGLALGPDGAIYCCEMDGHRVVRYERDPGGDRDGTRTTIVESYGDARLNSPNDLVFDSAGRLWFTDPDYDHQDDLELGHFSVYRIDDPTDADAPVDDLVRVTRDTTNPNGLAISPDEATLYVAQSEYGEGNPRELRAYSLEDGRAAEYEVLHNFYPHRGIDGMCLDAAGNLVAAAGSHGGGPGPMYYVFTPAGRVMETHPYPGDTPTNCTFGGESRRDLYVTGFDAPVYRVETGRAGQ
jgi:gluconolactonase